MLLSQTGGEGVTEWRPMGQTTVLDRTSDADSPCYVPSLDRLAICVSGGALN